MHVGWPISRWPPHIPDGCGNACALIAQPSLKCLCQARISRHFRITSYTRLSWGFAMDAHSNEGGPPRPRRHTSLLCGSKAHRQLTPGFFCLLFTVPGGAPQNFSAVGMSSTSVKLTWDQPAKALRNGEIIMYEVIYHKVQDPIDTFDINTTDTQLLVEGLEMNQEYVFQVKAYTSQGPGPWSNRHPFRTFGQCKSWLLMCQSYMMTSSNGNIFRVTGHLCGEFTGPRWIPCTKASDAELWCFLSSASE